ncbi:MAG: peptidoglycan-associated lipoprotein Pal [Alphaproteobacteria bacterium]|nr:peptidoglycan-associated lipoprotein Pal [Alphaproteobacteria bacterium]
MIKRLLTICAATMLLAACETASTDSNEVVGSSSAASSGSDAAASASSNTSDGSTSASSEASEASGSSGSNSADSDMQTPDEMLAKVGSTVYFGYDESTLSAEAQATLDRQAAFLKANPTIRIVIEGHCDERGTREYNLALGDRRASAARDYLVAKGVNASRLTTISYGKERPAVGGSNDTSYALNRRSMSKIN